MDHRGSRIEPVESVESSARLAGIDADDAPPHGGARRRQHRREFGGGVERDDRATIGQQRRHAGRDGLVGTRAGEDETMGAAPIEVEEEQRRFAALAPGRAIARIEGDAGAGILIDAIGLADDDASQRARVGGNAEQRRRFLHRHPVGMTEGVGPRALDRFDVGPTKRSAKKDLAAEGGRQQAERACEADVEMGEAKNVAPRRRRPQTDEVMDFRP